MLFTVTLVISNMVKDLKRFVKETNKQFRLTLAPSAHMQAIHEKIFIIAVNEYIRKVCERLGVPVCET